MRIPKRIAEVYREGGLPGIARQTGVKLAYWHRWATFRPHVIEKTLAGHTFKVAINNQFAQGWVEEHPEWRELEWLATHLIREGDKVVDCGANNGFTTVFFAHFVGPCGRVIAFEPFRSNLDDIQQNLALNLCSNVEVIPKAVGSKPGRVRFIAETNGMVTSDDVKDAIDVDIVRLDDVITDFTPSLLKIDVEGYELEVLRGATRILATCPKLDVEVHPRLHANPCSACDDILNLISANDYEIFIQRGIDAGINLFRPAIHTSSVLAALQVFHIFARPR